MTDTAHQQWMLAALKQAEIAMRLGEVPVGAVVVMNDAVVGAGFNQSINMVDPTAHAEMVALRAAARATGNYRLTGATLYVTVEPCLMCVGAMVHARVGTLVYGAAEPKWGAICSTIAAHEAPGLNHRLEIVSGVCEEACRELMQGFFKDRRKPAGAEGE